MKTVFDLTESNLGPAKRGKKILFANVPADGHFNPLTGLAVHLKSVGYDVRWYSSKHYADKIAKLKIRYYPFKKALDVTADNLANVFPERAKHKSQVSKLRFDIINFFVLRSTEYFEDISEIRKTFPFDLVITDVAFSAIPFIKEKMQVPVISIGIFPLSETSKNLAPSGLAITPSYSMFGQAKQYLLRLFADKVLFAKPTSVMKKLLANHGIKSSNSNVFDILYRKSTLMLQSGTAGFEYPRDDMSQNIRFIGPLLPSTLARKEPAWFDERLNSYRKVILVTQGTVERDTEKIIVPTLEAFKNTDCLVVATTGGSDTVALRERYQYSNIIIEDFIPFADIMPYADVYVTNGGYGGVMLAIQNQLPLVVAGIHEGKNEINARVGYFKLGINLKTETPKPGQVKAAVDKVLSEQLYLDNVKKLSREFSQFDPLQMTSYYVAEVLNNYHEDAVRLTVANIDYPQRMAIY